MEEKSQGRHQEHRTQARVERCNKAIGDKGCKAQCSSQAHHNTQQRPPPRRERVKWANPLGERENAGSVACHNAPEHKAKAHQHHCRNRQVPPQLFARHLGVCTYALRGYNRPREAPNECRNNKQPSTSEPHCWLYFEKLYRWRNSLCFSAESEVKYAFHPGQKPMCHRQNLPTNERGACSYFALIGHVSHLYFSISVIYWVF